MSCGAVWAKLSYLVDVMWGCVGRIISPSDRAVSAELSYLVDTQQVGTKHLIAVLYAIRHLL